MAHTSRRQTSTLRASQPSSRRAAMNFAVKYTSYYSTKDYHAVHHDANRVMYEAAFGCMAHLDAVSNTFFLSVQLVQCRIFVRQQRVELRHPPVQLALHQLQELCPLEPSTLHLTMPMSPRTCCTKKGYHRELGSCQHSIHSAKHSSHKSQQCSETDTDI
eukprot:365171-Chlamydomonas_euryale.AAC.7